MLFVVLARPSVLPSAKCFEVHFSNLCQCCDHPLIHRRWEFLAFNLPLMPFVYWHLSYFHIFVDESCKIMTSVLDNFVSCGHFLHFPSAIYFPDHRLDPDRCHHLNYSTLEILISLKHINSTVCPLPLILSFKFIATIRPAKTSHSIVP